MLTTMNRYMKNKLVFSVLTIAMGGLMIFVFGTDIGRSGGKIDGYGKMMGKVITQEQLRHHIHAVMLNYYVQNNEPVDLRRADDRSVIKSLYPRAINRIRVLHEAKIQGFDQVTDAELVDYIRAQAAFQTKGKFDKNKYGYFREAFFKKQPISMGDFDQMMREEVVVERFTARMQAGVSSDGQLRLGTMMNALQPVYSFKEFKYYMHMNQKVTDAEIKSEYENQKNAKYRIPDRTQAKLALFPVDTNAPGYEPPSDEEIEAYYKKNIKDYKIEPQVRASHILIPYKGVGTSDRTKEEAKKHAEELLKKVKAKGADFAKIAAKESSCSSKNKGGDLGYFPRKGKMVEPFSKAAFKLKKNEISPVVESEFGFHIIKKTGERKGSTKALKAVREQIVKRLDTERNDSIYEGQAKKEYEAKKKADYTKKQVKANYIWIRKKATKEEPELDRQAAEGVAKEAKKVKDLAEFGKEIQKKNEKMELYSHTTEWLDIDDPNSKKQGYLKKAFAMKKGDVSDLIEEPDGYYIVQKVDERDAIPFEDAKKKLIPELKRKHEKAVADAVKKRAEAFHAKLVAKKAQGAELVKLMAAEAAKEKVSVETTKYIGNKTKEYYNNLLGGVMSTEVYRHIAGLSKAQPLTKPFRLKDYYCVACLNDIQASRTPKLAEVKGEIRRELSRGKAVTTARQKAQSQMKSITAQLEKGLVSPLLKDFRKASSRDQLMQMMQMARFMNRQNPELDAYSLAMSAEPGELKIKNQEDGALLVYMEGYKLGDTSRLKSTFDMFKDRQVGMLQVNWEKALEQRYPFMVSKQFDDVFSPEKKDTK